jgi:hypothetical protein
LAAHNSSIKEISESGEIAEPFSALIVSGQFTTKNVEGLLRGFEALGPELDQRARSPSVKWVNLNGTKVKQIAEKARKSLENLLIVLEKSNEPGHSSSLLHPAQRVQLIALMKSVIAELEGEILEKNRTSSILSWLAKIASRAAEKEATAALSSGLAEVTANMGKLISATEDEKTSKSLD